MSSSHVNVHVHMYILLNGRLPYYRVRAHSWLNPNKQLDFCGRKNELCACDAKLHLIPDDYQTLAKSSEIYQIYSNKVSCTFPCTWRTHVHTCKVTWQCGSADIGKQISNAINLDPFNHLSHLQSVFSRMDNSIQ